MDDNLKCCPFCGGNAKIISTGFGMSSFYVMCMDDKCEVSPATKYYHEEREAINAWNKRARSVSDISENLNNIDALIKKQKERISEIDSIIDGMNKKFNELTLNISIEKP